MSALGGNNSDLIRDLTEALRSVARDIAQAGANVRSSIAPIQAAGQPGNFGAYVGGMVGGAPGAVVGELMGNNFFVNAARKAAGEFAMDVSSGVAGDYAKYGTSFGAGFEQSVTSNALRAGTNIPFFGDVVNEVEGPRQAAGNRLKAIVSQVARAGGTVDPEIEKMVGKQFLAEEQRAFQAAKGVDQLFDSQEMMGAALENAPRFNEMLDAASAGLDRLTSVLEVNANALESAFGSLLRALQGGYR